MVAAADIARKKVSSRANTFEIPESYNREKELLDLADLNGLIVITPSTFHELNVTIARQESALFARSFAHAVEAGWEILPMAVKNSNRLPVDNEIRLSDRQECLRPTLRYRKRSSS